jgi:hypothetical protein
VEQQDSGANGDGAPFILDRHGHKMEGRDDGRRIAALREGLTSNSGARLGTADAGQEDLERILDTLHTREYLDALRKVSWDEPTMMPEWAPPGLPADSPVWAGVVATAFEGVRTAITAAERIVAGRALHLCALPASRPPRRPGLVWRLLLPEHRSRGRLHAVRGRREAGGDPRRRLPLPHRDVGDRGAP